MILRSIIIADNPNGSLLRLGKTKFNGKVLLKICFNGSSELMNNISMSVVSMLYNVQLLRYAGENGIAIYGVLMYVSVVFENFIHIDTFFDSALA